MSPHDAAVHFSAHFFFAAGLASNSDKDRSRKRKDLYLLLSVKLFLFCTAALSRILHFYQFDVIAAALKSQYCCKVGKQKSAFVVSVSRESRVKLNWMFFTVLMS